MAKQSTAASFAKAAKRIRSIKGFMRRVTQIGLRGIGEEILTDVKASTSGHGVPVDKGNLRASGVVEQPSPSAVEISFGNEAVQYALIQHEDVSLHHKVGEARYLVRGLERWKPDGSVAMEAMKANTEAGIKAAGKG